MREVVPSLVDVQAVLLEVMMELAGAASQSGCIASALDTANLPAR